MEIKNDSQQKMKDRLKMYDNTMAEDELEELIKDPEVNSYFINKLVLRFILILIFGIYL